MAKLNFAEHVGEDPSQLVEVEVSIMFLRNTEKQNYKYEDILWSNL
jgi:hypothetical protein